MRSEFTRRLLDWLSRLGFLLLCLLVIAVGEWLPVMPAVQRYQDAHPAVDQVLRVVTLVMTVFGILLLALTQFLVYVPEPRRRSRAQMTKVKGVIKGPGRFFSGIRWSAGFSDQAPIWRLKQSFRDGEWRRAPRWRRFSLMMLGAVLLFYGLFGLLFLLSPAGLKLFLFLVVAYATSRTVYAFVVDRPSRKEGDGAR